MLLLKFSHMALAATHNEQEFHIGDTVRVHQRIQEDEKIRTQVFEGTVIAIEGEEAGKTFTVRRIATGGVGIERIFPLASPLIEKIEVAARGAVRRAKLYFLREEPAREVAEITKRYSRKKQLAKAKTKSAKGRTSTGRKNVKSKSRKTGRRSSKKTAKK